MSLFMDIYHKTLQENEKKLRFWEDYLQNLKSLDFNVFCDKLKVPVLVPIGSRILFRGELKHTNEVTVALGADYFIKCSLKQAEVLRQHRIKGAESKLETFRTEREYLENQLTFRKQRVLDNQGQEIIEVHTEEEDRVWRELHREKIRQWKQKGEDMNVQEELTDEELWNRLEELELQEELENELMQEENEESYEVHKDKITDKKEEILFEAKKEKEQNNEKTVDKTNKKMEFKETADTKVTEKYELLQKVLEKQNNLEEKLMELRNKDRNKSKTEADLISKLDEMEALDELQDEMDRLEDIIDTEDVETEEEEDDDNEEEESTSTSHSTDSKRKVYFADEDDSETLELAFHHSDAEPNKEPYNSKEGITKPSDIYEAYSNLFTETISILKKSKYEEKDLDAKIAKQQPKHEKKKVDWPIEDITRTIVVNDVVEKADISESSNNNKTEKRPVSLFKQLRQQKKS
ncbi:unconventional prefoldin RPB5 interactor-like protein [Pectinophora gossypiella]|uniref:Unconventional prefoldin RPB5 interactor n=1 Tax=Pectinophora gossypiella TaxID=13191 RepID=A0A1E1VXT5_PECGO|nr:unconventional prefoldin RPB5 interactor-like protein [Pectinophora gossypiella]